MQPKSQSFTLGEVQKLNLLARNLSTRPEHQIPRKLEIKQNKDQVLIQNTSNLACKLNKLEFYLWVI